MKDKANAIDQWFSEHPRLGSVISAILFFLGIRYLGEVITAFLSGRPPDFSPWRGGWLDTKEGWLGLLIAGLVILVFSVLAKYLFRRYVGKP